MRIYLVELTAIVDSLGTAQVFRFSTGGYITEPTDTPPNAVYQDRLKQPALVRRDMYSNATTGGASRVGIGEMILVNLDGGLDEMRNYGFDGQPLVVKVGESRAPFSSFTPVLTGTMEQVELDQRELRIRVRDRQVELAEPIQPIRYLGTGGLEGTDLDVKGRVKPLIYGQVFNIIPVSVNPLKQIYQVAANPINDIQFVYDAGIALVRETPDYASEAQLQDDLLKPAAGKFRVYQGYFRLSARPTGVLTVDAVEGSNAAARSTAQVIKRLALQAGIPALDIDNTDITQLDLANPAPVGIYIDQDFTGLQAMDEVAQSIGAYFGFDQLGKFRVGRLSAPLGNPVATIDENSIIGNELERVVSRDDGRGIPTYRVNLEYAKNYTVQGLDQLAAAVADERAAELSLPFRTITVEDTNILLKHRLAPELARQTLLINELDAQAEATRLLTLYKVLREVYEVTVRLEDSIISLLDIGEEVAIRYRRFGLNMGKTFIVIGLEVDYQLNRASLTLWG